MRCVASPRDDIPPCGTLRSDLPPGGDTLAAVVRHPGGMRSFLGRVGPLMMSLAVIGGLTACSSGTDSPDAANPSDSGTSLAASSAPAGSGDGSTQALSPWPPNVVVGQADPQPARSSVEVVRELPHDPALFTQGLEIAGGELYESTGQYGSSQVQRRPIDGGEPLAQVPMATDEFGEGLTLTPDTLWTLTWKKQVAHARDPQTLEVRQEVPYEGEGWGICHDDSRLIMSNGSDELTFRDPVTFAPTGTVKVTAGGEPVPWINELECVDGAVLANVFKTSEILRIDPATGVVTDIYDASALQQPRPQHTDAVLNGIAALPDSENFLVTGKMWPTMYEVRLGG